MNLDLAIPTIDIAMPTARPKPPRARRRAPEGLTNVEVDGVVVAVTSRSNIGQDPPGLGELGDRKSLQAALAAIAPAVGTRSAIDALAGVLIDVHDEHAVLSATDMSITAVLHLEAPGQSDVRVLVEHRKAKNAVKLLTDGPIRVTGALDGPVHKLEAGTRTIGLAPLRMEDMPPPARLADHLADCGARELLEAIDFCLPAVSSDETRPILTDAQLVALPDGTAVLRATDSYRAHWHPVPGLELPAGSDVRLSGALLKALRPRLKQDPQASWKLGHDAPVTAQLTGPGGEQWTGRGADGQFPNLDQILPDRDAYTITVRCDRDELLSSMDAANQMAARNAPARVQIDTAGALTIVVRDHDSGGNALEDRIQSARVSGCPDGIELGVNPEFTRDALKAMPAGELQLGLITPLRPLCLSTGAPGDAGSPGCLLMPIRLNV